MEEGYLYTKIKGHEEKQMLELIDQAADIVEHYRSQREQIGLDYNVFTLMELRDTKSMF